MHGERHFAAVTRLTSLSPAREVAKALRFSLALLGRGLLSRHLLRRLKRARGRAAAAASAATAAAAAAAAAPPARCGRVRLLPSTLSKRMGTWLELGYLRQ